ncbi:helix-turn-helix domain-containing protein [Carnobacterium maltaromaticum]|uniref:helix-turn-helix domain-containing protein n=1 Tax=Carnobacterium maltaromaticum TaxID=2751 RepID=UPI0039BE7AAE
MIKLGDKIKKNRLENGLTQAELAEGICTQASISNLENNTSTPSLMILLEIGSRLNIELNELSEYAIEQANPIFTVFKKVQDLRSQFKLKEACDLIKKEIDVKELKTNQEKKVKSTILCKILYNALTIFYLANLIYFLDEESHSSC